MFVTGGRPTQELAGDQPKNWWANKPRLAGDQSENAPCGSWLFLAGSWLVLAVSGYSWLLLAAPGRSWRFVAATGGSWLLQLQHKGVLVAVGQFLVAVVWFLIAIYKFGIENCC